MLEPEPLLPLLTALPSPGRCMGNAHWSPLGRPARRLMRSSADQPLKRSPGFAIEALAERGRRFCCKRAGRAAQSVAGWRYQGRRCRDARGLPSGLAG